MNGISKNMLIWAAIFLALVLLFQAFQGGSMGGSAQKMDYSEFVSSVDAGRVQRALGVVPTLGCEHRHKVRRD